MIIDELVLQDFRVFRGRHVFDLAPRTISGQERPIILFGGLNGAGKTTILTALKLAIYGKGMLGNVSQSEYQGYLSASIHKMVDGVFKPLYSSVQITFRHAHHGLFNVYEVKRDWKVLESGKVKESLRIVCDGDEKSELTYEQAQAFLNELIPIGVSELFFFDGEKIKELAEETTGGLLRSSIEKLLGLDVISRLDSDLSVLVRTRSAKNASQEKLNTIKALEVDLASAKELLAARQVDFQAVDISFKQLNKNIEALQREIDSRGGAWSIKKKEEAKVLGELNLQKDFLEAAIRDVVSGTLPLVIAKKLGNDLASTLDLESSFKLDGKLSGLIAAKRSEFIEKVGGFSNHSDVISVYDSLFAGLETRYPTLLTHDLSDSQVASIKHRLESAANEQQKAQDLISQLVIVEEKIDSVGLNMSRAPDDEVMQPLTSRLLSLSVDLGEAKAYRAQAANELRQIASNAVDISKKLDRLYGELSDSSNKDRLFELAENSRVVLKEFIKRTSIRKIRKLESEFQKALQKLSRKNRDSISISIDEKTFSVTLRDTSGAEINKNELSAGEKQIYAIALLEGLARTSGRNLPVIIDTPLGRLDSYHRKNLVDHYFPEASHQVLILSTDTEIDPSFYADLGGSISHTYYLSFDQESGSTMVQDGYFERLGGDNEFSQ